VTGLYSNRLNYRTIPFLEAAFWLALILYRQKHLFASLCARALFLPDCECKVSTFFRLHQIFRQEILKFFSYSMSATEYKHFSQSLFFACFFVSIDLHSGHGTGS